MSAVAPDEAMGMVTNVAEGDTIDVQLQGHDSRIAEDLIRIRLADIDTTGMITSQGRLRKPTPPMAKECHGISGPG